MKQRRILTKVCVLLLSLRFANAAGQLSVFGYRWTVPNPQDWAVAQSPNGAVLRLLAGREPAATGPRRPFQFAIADTTPFRKLHVEVDVKALGHSVMIVFTYRDPAHFNYAHLSSDTANSEPHHNGIFHVYGGERVRISTDRGPAAFAADHAWHHAVLDWDGDSGAVTVAVDGTAIPALHAVDLSLNSGKVGLGSFDETAEFKDVRIAGR